MLNLKLLSAMIALSASLVGPGAEINVEPEKSEVVIRIVGDDLIHAPIYNSCAVGDGTYNFDKVFEHIKDDISSADIGIINQETIMVHDRNAISSYPCFGTPEEIGKSIVNAGFDIVAHATNHTMDKGLGGIENTIKYWESNYPEEITYLGIHKDNEDSDIRYIEKNGIKISFVNYTYGLNGFTRKGQNHVVDLLEDADINSTMAEACENSDIQIAVLHLGDEYVYKPTEYEQRNVNKFIDLGADIVLCAHPHVLEPYGEITTAAGNKAIVYYSLGNFVSAQNEIPRVLGGMADITIEKDKDGTRVKEFSLVPLVTHQESGNYTTYKLSDYNEDLASRHKLRGKGLSIDSLKALYTKITGESVE